MSPLHPTRFARRPLPARGDRCARSGRVKSRPMVPARFDEFGEIALADANEIGVREALGIIEDGDDLRRQPQRRHRLGVGTRHDFIFGVAVQEDFRRMVDLALVGDHTAVAAIDRPLICSGCG